MFHRHPKFTCYEELPAGQWDNLRKHSLVCESDGVYTPRHAEQSLLYAVVSENLMICRGLALQGNPISSPRCASASGVKATEKVRQLTASALFFVLDVGLDRNFGNEDDEKEGNERSDGSNQEDISQAGLQ